jgi:hypothetical protein
MFMETRGWANAGLPLLVVVLGMGFGASAVEAQVATTFIETAPLERTEQDAFLKAHNDPRKKVGVGPVEWSEDLAEYAAKWLSHQAEGLAKEAAEGFSEGTLPRPRHRPPDGEFAQMHGENLAWWAGGKRTAVKPERAVAFWLEEKADFDKLNANNTFEYGDPTDKVIGHYTQMVWRGTTRIGAARLVFELTDRRTGEVRKYVIVVCNYDPPGNTFGEKPY